MSFEAHSCPNGHVTYPRHTVCPKCGEEQTEIVDLTDEVGTVVTWTTSTATPPGVREPNHLAIVEFNLGETNVRALGQTTDPVETGDQVTPVFCKELRDPGAGIREKESQDWDGYRFSPV
ncbi:Zn-ribbon domain-containing OB-fold protein [Natrinema sp. LN54]|uniref:Zn-ribbon domain-containing OB-fold protein n=1 Tax=Natrinema sp. LN54 TaxID=3458705 RepID=UPI004035B74C